jgi:hypothetical protein
MHYRLYALNPATGKIMQGRDIAAENDADAIAAGRRAHPENPFEVWCQQRLVYTSTDKDTRARA